MSEDMIEATGFVCVDFRRNNHVVHVRLDYEIRATAYGYHIEFTKIGTQDPLLLMKLKDPEIKAIILGYIINQITGKLPSTGELSIRGVKVGEGKSEKAKEKA